jgi:alpha-L-fucosidase
VLNAPIATYLLADPVKRALPWNRTEDALTIDLPPTPPDPFDCVVAVVVKGKPDITDPPEFVTDVDSFTDMLAVVLSSDRDNIEIRYSEGINDPLITSSLYNGPIHLNTTTTLSIRCFRDGRPVSGTATRTFRKVEPLKQVAAANLTRGIGYRYYEGEWDSLPAFNALKPVKEGVLSDFSFKPRNQDERFAFDYNGFIAIPETGVYTFFVGSDDGSRLWIDGTLVVNNDGLHGLQEKQGNVPLEKGYHRLRVGFFERTGSDNIAVYVKSQTLPKRLLPAEWLYTNK